MKNVRHDTRGHDIDTMNVYMIEKVGDTVSVRDDMAGAFVDRSHDM